MLCLKDAVVQSSTLNARLYDSLMQYIDVDVPDVTPGGSSRPLKASVRKYIEKWLLVRATCRVRAAWTDLGPSFWPRWVRRGSCDGDTDGRRYHAPSCSWPPGMRCVPEHSQTVRLLRWQCRRQRRTNSRQKTGGAEGRRRRSRGLRSDGILLHSAAKYSYDSAWNWRCRWKKVPYAVTTACYCSC